MSWFSDLFKPSPYKPPSFLGALIDGRPDSTKVNDLTFDETIGAAAAVNWQPKITFRTFPTLNQFTSSMCGAFSLRKYLGIYYQTKYKDWLDLSEEDIYQRRYNKPYAGMSLPDMFKILQSGVTLKDLTKVNVKTDSDADNAVIERWKHDIGAQFFSLQGEPIYIKAGDMETIASVIQTTGKGVIGMMFFTSQEWSQAIPKVIDKNLTSDKGLRHFGVFSDYGLLNGVKVLKFDDSAHFGGLSERYITQDFLSKRNMANAYGMNLKFEISDLPLKPRFDGSIISAQECLRTEGFFPTNVPFVENVGPLTKAALFKFQDRYSISITESLDSTTRNKLRQLYP